MKVIRCVGVEERPVTLESNFPQQTGRLELVQGIVDGCERYMNARGERLLMQRFRAYVPIAAAEQDGGKT